MKNKIIGDSYEIQKQLGKNWGRRTLLVRDINSQELAVIKLLLFGNEVRWDDLKFFEREAETLKSLSHAAIPRYLDSFEINSSQFKGYALVQTYIEAQSLEQQRQTGRRFTEREIKQLAKSLLEILIYLHGCQPPVIHRDLKPSNILLTNRSGNSVGDVYLVDFGSVQTLAATEGGTITVVGTYGYMPPEQFGGRTVAASDLYSLGATLIYLITGTHPADSPEKHGQIQFEQVAHCSASFTAWLRQMIQPSLDQRFTSAKEALEALDLPLPRAVTSPRSASRPRSHRPLSDRIKLIKDKNIFKVESLKSRFDCYNLGINQQQITLTRKLFGKKYNCVVPSRKEDITKLVYIPEYYTRNLDSSAIHKKAQLIVWAGVRQYKLLGRDGEIEWLAQELSDWLSLPITRVEYNLSGSARRKPADKKIKPTNVTSPSIRQPVIVISPPANHQPAPSSVINQPADSKIKLTKDKNSLVIRFPNSLPWWGKLILIYPIGGISLYLLWLFLGIVIATVISIFQGVFIVLVIMLVFLRISIFIGSCWIGVIWSFFGHKYLRINQQQISLNLDFLGLTLPWTIFSARRQDINQLVYRPGYCKKYFKDRNINVKPQLIIVAGSKEYTIGSLEDNVSDTEINWLAQVLSDWLGLPITRIESIDEALEI